MEKVLSICIPTYNRRKYLERCIDNLLPQLCDEVEVLISNNCSPDDTDEYCKTLDSRITYHKQPENIGSDANFLWLLENANAKYTLILADDDYLEEGSLIKLIDFLRDKDLGLSVINPKRCMPDGTITVSDYAGDENVIYSENDLSKFLEYIGVQLTFLSGLIFNSELVKRVQNKKQYMNTNLLQTCVAFKCLEYNKSTAVIKKVVVISQFENSSGYNIYKVFVENWRNVLFVVGSEAGLPKKALVNVYNNTLSKCIARYIIKEKLYGLTFETNHKFKYFIGAWRFKNAWLRLYPVALMPKWLIKRILKFKKLL